MKRINVKPGQSVFDIAIQEYGSAQGVAILMEDNDISALELQVGQELHIRDEVIDKNVVNYFKSRSLTPANTLVYE